LKYRNPTRSSSAPGKVTVSGSARRIKLIAAATSHKDQEIRAVTPQPTDDATALARITKSFRIMDDVGAKGKEYRMTRGTTFEQCAQQCASDGNCRMFAYWKNQICYLFDGYLGTYPTKASLVGTKPQ